MMILRLALIFFFVTLAGCITPEAQRERRIAENIELFYEFPEEVREAIRRGKVDIGVDEDMVRLALGSPDRVSRRKDVDEDLANWQYFRPVTELEWVRMPVPYTDKKGRSRVRDEWFPILRDKEELKMKVEFSKGKVVAVETIESS